ncbi:MAG: N-acetyltransferase [Kiritimatiellae bacterium]|nr:N-acetyltransferase [Kiritimatiellia bacterium]
MLIRKSQPEDVPRIMGIYDRARKYMVDHGNPSQWINGYPSLELVLKDIMTGHGYVAVDGDDLVATFYFAIENEPTYARIQHGTWLNENTYGVVHRIAVDRHERGIATCCLEWCYQQIPNVRIDTHKNNQAMIRVLEKNGYTNCGFVFLDDGSERIAFQKTQ